MPERRPSVRWMITLLVPSALAALSACASNTADRDDAVRRALRVSAATADRSTPLPPALAEPPPADTPSGPLRLTVDEAILLALQHNKDLRVERINPALTQTGEDLARAVFDPVLGAEAAASRVRARSRVGNTSDTLPIRSDALTGALYLDEYLPTGTALRLRAAGEENDNSRNSGALSNARVALTVTQSLLRGYGLRTNLAALHQARLDTLASQYELRGFAEALVANAETAYWNYVLAERQIAIFSDSMALAERQMQETEERVRIGKLARIELAAAQAQVALRREALIAARSALATARLALLRLTNPPGQNLWDRELVLLEDPFIVPPSLADVREHVDVALRMRPEINQARLALDRGELTLVQTRNGLLPRLDLFITLGKSGYADAFGDAVERMPRDSFDASAGLGMEWPIGNRAAEARHRRATLSLAQAREALDNLAQLVETDVRAAYIQVERAREEITATQATRALQEETLRAESEKFRVGKSTSFQVAQAQRDLLQAQIAEISSRINLLKALVSLYRLEGSLLERRGLAAPNPLPPPDAR